MCMGTTYCVGASYYIQIFFLAVYTTTRVCLYHPATRMWLFFGYRHTWWLHRVKGVQPRFLVKTLCIVWSGCLATRTKKIQGVQYLEHNIHTHTCLERRGGTIRASLNFLRISEVFVIHRVARSQDYRNQRICAISRSAANGKYRTEKKRDGTQTSVTPESRPFQGNSTRNFCWCTPVHVLNHTSEEITIFAPKSFGQLNMRCCTILHGLTLFLRPRTSSLLTRTTVRRSKVLWMSFEVSLYKCTHTHTHTHNCSQSGIARQLYMHLYFFYISFCYIWAIIINHLRTP